MPKKSNFEHPTKKNKMKENENERKIKAKEKEKEKERTWKKILENDKKKNMK